MSLVTVSRGPQTSMGQRKGEFEVLHAQLSESCFPQRPSMDFYHTRRSQAGTQRCSFFY